MEPTPNPSRREGSQTPRRKASPSGRLEGLRSWNRRPITACHTRLLRTLGCAPSMDTCLLWESVMPAIMRWCRSVCGSSVISAKTWWSGSLLITDFRSLNGGPLLARLSVRGATEPCPASSRPSLKLWVSPRPDGCSLKEYADQMQVMISALTGISNVGQTFSIHTLQAPNGDPCAPYSNGQIVLTAYWLRHRCSGRFYLDVVCEIGTTAKTTYRSPT